MNQTPARREVAIAFPFTVPWMGLCLRGILDYAAAHGGWNLLTSPPTLSGSAEFSLTPASLKGWHGQGMIALLSDRKEIADARRLKISFVDLGGMFANPGHPRATVDQQAIGRIAAEHLLQCGFRRLAYYGFRGPWYSEQRGDGFRETAEKAGALCQVFEPDPPSNPRASWQQRLAPLDRWLRGLQTPIGILAVHDYRARFLLEACNRLGLNVPHDIALIGVDNDPSVCENCQPTLSSISRNGWQIGYRAAEMLDRLMNGEVLAEQDIRVPPEGIVARGSTDTLSVEDPCVSAAAHFFHDHFGELSAFRKVFLDVPISRRSLEMRFRRHLNCSPYEYLTQLRIEKAKQLLAAPEKMKIRVIAKNCGLSNSVRMRLVFLRHVKLTPLEYRRKQLGEIRKKNRKKRKKL
jgi:LacI family transcriptional regulator